MQPVETLLVVDAMTGQEAVAVAQAFRDAVPLTGLILTKIDGDARGGAALSISAVTGLAVKFMGTGEKTDALEVFHPDRLAGRILGMGDVMTLVERAQEHVDAAQAAKLEEKLRKAQFTLEDFLEQIQQVQKMGPMGQLMSMIPGMGGMAKEAQEAVDRGDLRRVEAIIRAMTPRERRDPAILNGSRRRRIAAGAGTDLTEVNRLIKQHAELSKLMKQFSGGGGRKRRDVRPDGPAVGETRAMTETHVRPADRDRRSRSIEPPAWDRTANRHARRAAPRGAEAVAAAPRRRRPSRPSTPPACRWLVALLGVVVVIAAQRPDRLARRRPAGRRRSALGYMPASIVNYAEVRLDLPGDQRQKLAAFLSAFPGFEDQSQIEPKINDVLDRIVRAASDGQADLDRRHPAVVRRPARRWASGLPGLRRELRRELRGDDAEMGGLADTLVVATITDRAKAAPWLTSTWRTPRR